MDFILSTKCLHMSIVWVHSSIEQIFNHFEMLPPRVLFSGCKVKVGLTLVGVFQEGSTLTC
jgi:hypothetical protein